MLAMALLVIPGFVQEPVVAVAVPSLGIVECQGRSWPGTDRPAVVECRDSSGRGLARVPVDGEYIRLKALQDSPLGIPVVVAIGAAPGGSDTTFTTALIAERDGTLVDLWPGHWYTNISDRLCIGSFREGQLGVLGLAFIWGQGKGESHYAPHRFRATRYLWNGSALRFDGAEVTRDRVPDWKEAAMELGYTCPNPYGGVEGLDAFR
jgi:hypothetical protein